MPWHPMFALPNLWLADAIEVDGFALVPWADARLRQMASQHARFNSLLSAFRTEFGDNIEPPVIIWRDDKPNTYRSIAAISGFRDAIALSVIPGGWARSLKWQRHDGAHYSDTFSVYPWMIDRNNEDLITRTPAMFGVHQVSRLRPQSTPALPIFHLNARDLDAPLLHALLNRWQRCFERETQPEEEERLFRSLNMANAAAKMPAGADTNLYDTLRSVALWASAFEILRPARNQAYREIYKVLDSIQWNNSACTTSVYRCFGDAEGTLRALPHWIYGEIARLRNDTLHGNPIGADRLRPGNAERAISMYAAPLYRIVLAAVIELTHQPGTRPSDYTEFENYLHDEFEYRRYQRDIESALATVFLTEQEMQARQRGRIA